MGDHGGDQLCGAGLLGGEGQLLALPVECCVRLLQVCALRWGQALAWTRVASACVRESGAGIAEQVGG